LCVSEPTSFELNNTVILTAFYILNYLTLTFIKVMQTKNSYQGHETLYEVLIL